MGGAPPTPGKDLMPFLLQEGIILFQREKSEGHQKERMVTHVHGCKSLPRGGALRTWSRAAGLRMPTPHSSHPGFTARSPL